MSSTSVILNTVSPSSDPYPPASEYFYPTPSNAPLTVTRPSFASPGTPSSVPNVGTPPLFHKAIGNRTTDPTISVAKTLFMDDLVWPNKQRAYSELTKGSICFAGAEEGPDVGMHGGKMSRVRGLDWINKELARDEHLITPQQLVFSDINVLTERQPNLYGLLMRIFFALGVVYQENVGPDVNRFKDLLLVVRNDIEKLKTLIMEANEHASNKHATDPNGNSHEAEFDQNDLDRIVAALQPVLPLTWDRLGGVRNVQTKIDALNGTALLGKLTKIRFDSLGLQEHTSRILQQDLDTRNPSAPDSIQLYGDQVVSKIGHFLDSWNVCGVVIDGEANLAVDEDRLEGSRCQINVAVEGLAQVRSHTSYFVSGTPGRVVQEQRVEGIEKLAQDFGEKLVAGDEIFVALHLLPVRKDNQLRFKYMYQCWSSRQLIDAAYQTAAAFKNTYADGTIPGGVLNDAIRASLQHADLPSEPPQATKSKEPQRMLLSTIVGAWRIGSVIDTKAAVQKRDGGQADPFKRHAIQVAVDTKWMGLYELQTKYGWKSMLPGDGVDFDDYFTDPRGFLFLKRFFASYSVGSFFSSLMMNCREEYSYDSNCFNSSNGQVTNLINDVKTICGTSLSFVTLDTDRPREHLKELEEMEKQLRKKYVSEPDYTAGVATPFGTAIAELKAALDECEKFKAEMHSESVAFEQTKSSLLMFGCESESSTIDLIKRLSIVYRDDKPGTMLQTGRMDLQRIFLYFNLSKQRAVGQFVTVQSKIRESLEILEDYSSKKGAAALPTGFSLKAIEELVRKYKALLQQLLGTSSSGGASSGSSGSGACAFNTFTSSSSVNGDAVVKFPLQQTAKDWLNTGSPIQFQLILDELATALLPVAGREKFKKLSLFTREMVDSVTGEVNLLETIIDFSNTGPVSTDGTLQDVLKSVKAHVEAIELKGGWFNEIQATILIAETPGFASPEFKNPIRHLTLLLQITRTTGNQIQETDEDQFLNACRIIYVKFVCFQCVCQIIRDAQEDSLQNVLDGRSGLVLQGLIEEISRLPAQPDKTANDTLSILETSTYQDFTVALTPKDYVAEVVRNADNFTAVAFQTEEFASSMRSTEQSTQILTDEFKMLRAMLLPFLFKCEELKSAMSDTFSRITTLEAMPPEQSILRIRSSMVAAVEQAVTAESVQTINAKLGQISENSIEETIYSFITTFPFVFQFKVQQYKDLLVTNCISSYVVACQAVLISKSSKDSTNYSEYLIRFQEESFKKVSPLLRDYKSERKQFMEYYRSALTKNENSVQPYLKGSEFAALKTNISKFIKEHDDLINGITSDMATPEDISSSLLEYEKYVIAVMNLSSQILQRFQTAASACSVGDSTEAQESDEVQYNLFEENLNPLEARPPTSSSKTASLYDMMRSSQERSKVAANPSATGAASSQAPPSKRKEPLPPPQKHAPMPAPEVPIAADAASQKERGKKRAMTPARERVSLASAFGPSVPKNKASPTPSIRKANLPETSETSPMDVCGSGAASSRSSSSGSAVSSSSSSGSFVDVSAPSSSVLHPSDPTKPVAPTMANPSQPSLPVTASGGRAAYRPRKMADTRQKKSGQ